MTEKADKPRTHKASDEFGKPEKTPAKEEAREASAEFSQGEDNDAKDSRATGQG